MKIACFFKQEFVDFKINIFQCMSTIFNNLQLKKTFQNENTKQRLKKQKPTVCKHNFRFIRLHSFHFVGPFARQFDACFHCFSTSVHWQQSTVAKRVARHFQIISCGGEKKKIHHTTHTIGFELDTAKCN